jgi:putative transcriptional regulator
MVPKHHLPDDLIAEYAAGTCGEPESLFVASHLTLCAECRIKLVMHESIGGAAFDALAPLPVNLDPAAIAVDTLERPMPEPALSAGHEAMVVRQLAEAQLPKIFAPYMPEGLRWRFLAPGVKQVQLDLKWNGNPVRLVRFPPGYVVPLHTHVGPEYTLCLQGAFEDGDQVMHRGDVEVCDDIHRHLLRITKDGPCICLFVADAAPVPLTLLGRLLRPFLG